MQKTIDKVRCQMTVVSELQRLLNEGKGLRGEPLDPVMRLFFEYLLIRGRFFTPMSGHPAVRIHRVYTPEDRFRWATFLALSRRTVDLSYVEGVCCVGHRIFHHAWCATKDDMVVDNTVNLAKMPDLNKVVYYGIDVEENALKGSLIKRQTYGMFASKGG